MPWSRAAPTNVGFDADERRLDARARLEARQRRLDAGPPRPRQRGRVLAEVAAALVDLVRRAAGRRSSRSPRRGAPCPSRAGARPSTLRPDHLVGRERLDADVARAAPDEEVAPAVARQEDEVGIGDPLRRARSRSSTASSRETWPAVGSKIVSSCAVTRERRNTWSSERDRDVERGGVEARRRSRGRRAGRGRTTRGRTRPPRGGRPRRTGVRRPSRPSRARRSSAGVWAASSGVRPPRSSWGRSATPAAVTTSVFIARSARRGRGRLGSPGSRRRAKPVAGSTTRADPPWSAVDE